MNEAELEIFMESSVNNIKSEEHSILNKHQLPIWNKRNTPMPLINSAYELGKCLECIEKMDDKEMQEVAYAEYYYFSGQSEKAAEYAEKYLNHSNKSYALSAIWIYAYANLATGEIQKARMTLGKLEQLKSELNEDTPVEIMIMANLTTIGAAVLLHLPIPEETTPLQEMIRLLPPGLRLLALYVSAHYLYLQGDYSKSIGVVETALALQETLYPIPTIYLHLVATMNYMSLRQPERAKEHLMAAWEIAYPDDMIEGFGEHHGLLGGMLETALKKEYPEEFKRIIAITYRFSAGWRKVHNPNTGHDVADNLTTTEFTVAMLAARNWTNQEISEYMGISANTVKRHISVVLQKLDISNRKELKKYMLR